MGDFRVTSVLVIGGGIIGLCTAYELTKQGVSVTVLNAGSPTDGCSIGNAGMVVPSHFAPMASPGMVKLGLKMMTDPRSPFGFSEPWDPAVAAWSFHFLKNANSKHVHRTQGVICALNQASKALYQAYQTELTTDFGLNTDGLLMICRTFAALEHEAEVMKEAGELGLKTALLSADETQALYPDVEVSCVGSVHFLDDAQLSPAALIPALRTAIAQQGGVIHDHHRVDRITRQGRQIIGVTCTNDASFAADEYVVATGAWTGALAAKLGLNIPILAGKGYGFTMERPRLGVAAILTEDRVAVSPMLNGMRVTGTMEIGRVSDGINYRRLEGIYAAVPRYFPGLAEDVAAVAASGTHRIWQGSRPCPADGLPVMGRPRRYQNLTLASGHGMMGLSLGPISGRLAAQAVTGQTPEISLDLMHPDRFN
jgi:D-amino-acid dehydrogenase